MYLASYLQSSWRVLCNIQTASINVIITGDKRSLNDYIIKVCKSITLLHEIATLK